MNFNLLIRDIPHLSKIFIVKEAHVMKHYLRFAFLFVQIQGVKMNNE